MVVTVGSKGGVGAFNGISLPSFMVAKAKAFDSFTAGYWKKMGQEYRE